MYGAVTVPECENKAQFLLLWNQWFSLDPSEQAAVVTSSLFVQRSMFDSHVLPNIPFTSTINVALVQGISADTGCGSGANYPLSTPMIKVQNKTLLGSSQKLLYLQNSHCLVSIHKDFECQHDINDMTLCLMTSGSMRHQSLICGHRQVAFPQVVTCHLAFTLNRSFEHLSHIENHGALLHHYFWVVLSWHTRSRMAGPNRINDTIH